MGLRSHNSWQGGDTSTLVWQAVRHTIQWLHSMAKMSDSQLERRRQIKEFLWNQAFFLLPHPLTCTVKCQLLPAHLPTFPSLCYLEGVCGCQYLCLEGAMWGWYQTTARVGEVGLGICCNTQLYVGEGSESDVTRFSSSGSILKFAISLLSVLSNFLMYQVFFLLPHPLAIDPALGWL